MNRPDCAFAYSQARLQARLGARPDTADWQRLHATRDLELLLQGAAATSLAPWAAQLAARPAIHDSERRLREAWQATVDEVAGWQPQRWRGAITWLRWLPYLPALQKLARGGRAREWMRNDPVLGPLLALEPRGRGAGLRHTPLAPLEAGFVEPADVAQAWLSHWRSTWPRDRAATPALERIALAVRQHRRRLAELPVTAGTDEAREAVGRRLLVTLRRNPLSPAAAVAYLGLAALDLTQLRGAVAIRTLRRQAQDAA